MRQRLLTISNRLLDVAIRLLEREQADQRLLTAAKALRQLTA